MKTKLSKLDKFCSECEDSFYNEGRRAIIVFEDLQTKEKILKKYKISRWKVLHMFISNDYEE